RRDDRLRVVTSREGGWGRAVRLGLDAARGDVLGYTNTARTDPAAVPEYFRWCLEGGGCLVKARRRARRAPARSLGSALYNLEAFACFGLRCGDVNGTPKVFPRSVYERARPTSPGDLFDLELLVGVQRMGVPIREVTARGFRRHGGRSSTGLRTAW